MHAAGAEAPDLNNITLPGVKLVLTIDTICIKIAVVAVSAFLFLRGNGMNLKKIFVEGTNNTFIQFFRSLFVGGIATVVDFGVMIFFREVVHLYDYIAIVIGFIFGLAANYIISNLWVFSKAKVNNRVLDFVVFAVIGVIGMGLTQLIVAPFATEGIFGEGFLVTWALIPFVQPKHYYIIGKCVAVVLVYMWNFFARKFLLYNKTEQAEDEKQPEAEPSEPEQHNEKDNAEKKSD